MCTADIKEIENDVLAAFDTPRVGDTVEVQIGESFLTSTLLATFGSVAVVRINGEDHWVGIDWCRKVG